MRALPILFIAPCLAFSAVQFAPTAATIDVQGFVEVEVRAKAAAGNPFLDFALRGTLTTPDGTVLTVDGFCDSPDGSVHKIRFLAVQPGRYSYKLDFNNMYEKAIYSGAFTAQAASHKGLLQVDPEHPFHFQWAGTGEHYFWNGLTAYALLGWKDDAYIGEIIRRAADLKVNRLRVTPIGPRVADASRRYEPVKPSDRFQFLYGPWPAGDPANITDPKWDVTRYDTAFFRKAENAVRQARVTAPSTRGLAPFTNVTWDVTNEWHLFRNAWWVEQMGTYLKSIDPYRHLISTHGRGDFPWALSQWPDFALYQIWDEDGGYKVMRKHREAQLATGHPFPQINEEYGYQDHYPVKWGGGKRPPTRNADNRRRMAWEIAMAGCYQTTGEKANRNGDGQPPATPGGWINGGFDDSMHMLERYRHMVNFFESMPFWKLGPVADRVLAKAGQRYVVYLPNGGRQAVELASGRYRVRRYNPQNGEWAEGGIAEGGAWNTPESALGSDVVYLLERI